MGKTPLLSAVLQCSMATPEQMFQSRIVFAPDKNTGAPPPGLPDHEDQHQNLSEVPIDNTSLGIENVLPESKQNEVNAIGLAAQSLSVPQELPTEPTADQVQEIRGTIDMSTNHPHHTIREVGIPPIAEEAPKQSGLPAEEIYALRFQHSMSIDELAKRYDVSKSAIVATLKEEDARKGKEHSERWDKFNTAFLSEMEALDEAGGWPEDQEEKKKLIFRIVRENAKKLGMKRIVEGLPDENPD